MRLLEWASLLVALLFVTDCAPPTEARLPEPVPLASTPSGGRFIRELTTLDATLADGSQARFDTLIVRPDQKGRVPLVLLNHGSPRLASDRPTMTPTAFGAQAMAFARRGYGAVVVMRSGYGQTTGPFREAGGPCDDRDYLRAARASAEDVLAALRRLQDESWVDPKRVLLVGHSAGGFAVLAAAATNPKGVVGAISFAGGRGSDAPDHVCQPERLILAAKELGSTARVPSEWVYAENDHFFDPAFAAQLSEAYVGAGGLAELLIVPAYGDDGHMLFSHGAVDRWWPYVESFLVKAGLPTALAWPRQASTLAAPSAATPRMRAGFASYVASEGLEKAFAAGATAWGWASSKRTRAEAVEAALRLCGEHGKDCVLYAVGDAYAR